MIVPLVTPSTGRSQRREDRPQPEAIDSLDRHLSNLRREIDQVVKRHALVVKRGRLRRKRLCRRRYVARDVGLLRDGPFLDRPDRLAGDAVEGIDEALLADLGNGLDVTPVDRDVHQIWMGREVVVPEPVVNSLEVPQALAGLDVDGNQRL